MTDDASTPAAEQEEPAQDQGDEPEDGEGTEEAAVAEEPPDLVTQLDEIVEKIQSKEDEEDLGPLLSQLDDVEDVIDEAEDVLSTMDLSELSRAIDWSALPDAVDASALPEALEEGDLGDVIETRELLKAVDLSLLFDSVDEREFWRQKREFDDELEDVTGEESDELVEGGGFDVDVDGEAMGGDVDPRAIQASVQREISQAVGEFREKLVEAHHRLDELREENEARFDARRTRSKSRNPTAGFSTVTANPIGGGVGGRFSYSTVPEETKYSSAPNRKRIYGHRFDEAGGGDGE